MTTPRPISVSTRWLVAIYAVVPLALLASIADRLWFDGTLRLGVLRDQGDFVLYHLIAGTPHILASNVILFTNREYVRTYARRIQVFTVLVIATLVVGGLYLPRWVLFAVIGAITVTHLLRQQIGIGRGICRLNTPLYDAWGWITIVLGIVLYNTLYLDDALSAAQRSAVYGGLYALALALLGFTVACHRRIATRRGRLYLWANTAMTGTSLHLLAAGYPLLATLAPRFVHDVTAFTFYAVHDYNRHHATPRNAIYRALRPLGRGMLWASPVLALALTFVVTRAGDTVFNAAATAVLGLAVPYAVSFYFLLYLTLLHYFTEAFTWRSGSPYRRYVSVTA